MKIPCKAIAQEMEEDLKAKVQDLKKKGKTPHLIDILIGESEEQLSYIAIKKKVAHKLGIEFEFVQLDHSPIFEKFANLLKQYSSNPKATGIIIQQPLPSQLQTDSIFKYIPIEKEIEGHKAKTPFYPPLGLAVLSVIKHVYKEEATSDSPTVDMQKDASFFKKLLKNKKIVLVGRGVTGGQPIGKTLSQIKINYLSLNSKTHEPEQYYREADIIITAAGKTVINKSLIKPGAILINVGLHVENGKLVGDYSEKDIEKHALYYTGTPGGVGPIDVLYLYKNLIDATYMQLDQVSLHK